MIETRPQKAVAGGVDPGNPEACHRSLSAVSARGYNISASGPQRQLRQSHD
jgi:hypothetical protein